MKHVPIKSAADRAWCGPYALAVLSGRNYDETHRLVSELVAPIRRRNGRARGKYASTDSLTWMLNIEVEHISRDPALGLDMEFEYLTPVYARRAYCWPTLKSLRETLLPKRLYLVQLTGHYVVLDTNDWTVIDNQTKAWLPLAKHKHARKRTQAVAECRKFFCRRPPLGVDMPPQVD